MTPAEDRQRRIGTLFPAHGAIPGSGAASASAGQVSSIGSSHRGRGRVSRIALILPDNLLAAAASTCAGAPGRRNRPGFVEVVDLRGIDSQRRAGADCKVVFPSTMTELTFHGTPNALGAADTGTERRRRTDRRQRQYQSGRVGNWRADGRVRWLFRRFRAGPQSGSHSHVSSSRLVEPSVRFSRTRLSCWLHLSGYVALWTGSAFGT